MVGAEEVIEVLLGVAEVEVVHQDVGVDVGFRAARAEGALPVQKDLEVDVQVQLFTALAVAAAVVDSTEVVVGPQVADFAVGLVGVVAQVAQ